MPDLRTAIRAYYDGLIEPVTAEEIIRHPPAGDHRAVFRPLVALAVAAVVTLVGVGGLLIGTTLLDGDDRRSTPPGAVVEDYRFAGAAWLGFEFLYPGHRTDLTSTDAEVLVEGSLPFPQYTLLLLEGSERGMHSDVVWISHQTGHGSVVRDAVTVTADGFDPAVRLRCVADFAGDSNAPAFVLDAPDGTRLRAWYVDLARLSIEETDPARVQCTP